MNEKTTKTNKWLDKLKKVKHIEIYIAIIFIVILGLIYMSNFTGKTSSSTIKNTSDLTVTAYVEDLENNLKEIIESIGGVSNVKVMITLDMSNAEVQDSKINLSTFPPIKGIVVTAKGVKDISVKMSVLQAVEAVIDITNTNIEIISSG